MPALRAQPRISRVATLLCVAVAAAGCGRVGSQADFNEYKQLQQTPLRVLGVLYGKYMGRNRGRPPTDEAEFRKYLASSGQKELERFGVRDIDSLFVSPRDGEPMVVLYGKRVVPSTTGELPWIAYEPRSTNGARYVVGASGVVAIMRDEEFQDIVPNAS